MDYILAVTLHIQSPFYVSKVTVKQRSVLNIYLTSCNKATLVKTHFNGNLEYLLTTKYNSIEYVSFTYDGRILYKPIA